MGQGHECLEDVGTTAAFYASILCLFVFLLFSVSSLKNIFIFFRRISRVDEHFMRFAESAVILQCEIFRSQEMPKFRFHVPPQACVISVFNYVITYPLSFE